MQKVNQGKREGLQKERGEVQLGPAQEKQNKECVD
jgi:hypothetical protein